MADIKSKSNEGQKKSHNNVVRRKGTREKSMTEKEKQTQQQQQQNNRQNHNTQVNNKNNKKKHPQQQQQHHHQQQENTKKKVHEQKFKNNMKNAKDKKKEFKNKGNKKPAKQVNVNKPKGIFKKFLEILFIIGIISMTFLWYLYIVDIERYRTVRDVGAKAAYSVVQLLPAEVLAKGHRAIEFIRPAVDVVAVKVQVFINQTSTVLNTNPVLKDHWSNINEIGAVIGGQIAEYMRTVYKQIPVFFDNAKNKFF